jgi:uncharacterized protein YciI
MPNAERKITMPSWAEYKKMAIERGSLALELYVVLSTPSGSAENVKSNLGEHLAYQSEQESLGHLAFAGPLSDESGEMMDGAGMIIYRAESLEAARQIASSDPMHASGARSFTIRRWLVNEGSLSLSVKLSKQEVKLT